MEETLSCPLVPMGNSASLSMDNSIGQSDFHNIDWGHLSTLNVYSANGDKLAFRQVYRPLRRVEEGYVIINILSNYACYGMVARLTQWRAAVDAVESCDTRLVFLATGTPAQTRKFIQQLEDDGLTMPGELYCDPSIEVYKAFSLRRGVLRTMVPPMTKGFVKFGASNVFEGIKTRIKDRRLIGDPWQLGGAFVVRSRHEDAHFRPELIFGHRDGNTMTTPSVPELLTKVGYEERLTIDPQKMLTDFHKTRKLLLLENGVGGKNSSRMTSRQGSLDVRSMDFRSLDSRSLDMRNVDRRNATGKIDDASRSCDTGGTYAVPLMGRSSTIFFPEEPAFYA